MSAGRNGQTSVPVLLSGSADCKQEGKPSRLGCLAVPIAIALSGVVAISAIALLVHLIVKLSQ